MLARMLALCALAISCVGAAAAHEVNTITQAFSSAKIVPDVLSSFNPKGLLDVGIMNNNSNTPITITPGMNLSTVAVAHRPHFSLWSDDNSVQGKTFVLIMLDPDAPTPQDHSQGPIRHLVAPGMKINGTLANSAPLVNTTPALSDYVGPNPAAGSDPHRYVFLLFVQPDAFAAAASHYVNGSTPKYNFNVTQFAQETGLGSPVAGNFFLAGPADDAAVNATASSTAHATATSHPSGKSSGQLAFGFTREMGVVGATIAAAVIGAVLL